METRRKLIHVTQMPIRWGDMDAMGHVNNTIYFRYVEQARIEWMQTLGVGTSQTAAEGPVIVNASCTFIIPLTYPGTVEVRTFVGHPGRSSLPTHYEIRRVGEETLYAEGSAKIVWINPQTGKSIPLPDRMRQLASED
ncbi:MAG: thioesterase [Rhodocyclaceae bacterium]|jgi:acyl-CoA thioester hydrolase|nr:thioesterase [Rhodocyclaceae bacterium]